MTDNENDEKLIHDIIEDIVWEYDVSYFEASVIYCKDNDVEVESFSKMINKDQKLRRLIYEDAEKLNLVEKIPRFNEDFQE